jgi:hypothetical protein
VRLRHAEALALAGWYLMVPPLVGKYNPIPAWSKPFSQWKVIGTFDSKNACEVSRADFLKSSRTRSLPICVASGDLRYK